MRIKFWGVRGSIPCPGPNTVKYGGNTPCISLRFEALNRLIIIDAGSGLRELGNDLMANHFSNGPINTEIFLSHTHWDHIMGFPFFVPIYVPGTKIRIYGPVTYQDESLEDVVGGQLTYRYFPVRQAELSSDIEYIDLKEECLEIGDGIIVKTKYLNHPIICLGYRFEYRGKVLCTAYDTEPFQNVFCTDPEDPTYDEEMAKEGEEVAREENQRIERFLKGADLLIYDAQYTQKEYVSSKVGWGHTSLEHAIAAAKRCDVKKMALFHHEPMRSDREFDELVDEYCNPKYTGNLECFFAREGMEIDL